MAFPGKMQGYGFEGVEVMSCYEENLIIAAELMSSGFVSHTT